MAATPSGGAFPANVDDIVARFNPSDPNYLNRNAKVRAYANDYSIPERVYQYTTSVQQELPGVHGTDRGLHRQPGPQPVPAQRRESISSRS